MGSELKAPFPWFGGKSKVASLVWARFGNVENYVEPFFGSGAVLLGRGEVGSIETVNDLDGFIANFWRAVSHEPDAVANLAIDPVNEIDLTARHRWLVERRKELTEKLVADPEFYDARIAAWWVWGISQWIGSGWCAGNVPRQRPHLGHAGIGVHRKLPHLGDAGRGVHRMLPCEPGENRLTDWFQALRDRLARVRVCCGDWTRVLSPAVTFGNGGIGPNSTTGVFLDPPYADTAERTDSLYACESLTVAHEVRAWAIENGNNKAMRIALCGYEGEHIFPDTWECVPWKAQGGYGNKSNKGKDNARKERIWFSPHCLKPETRQQAFTFIE